MMNVHIMTENVKKSLQVVKVFQFELMRLFLGLGLFLNRFQSA